MKSRMKNIVFALFTGLMISCSTQTVAVDYDRNQDFSLLKEYQIEIPENSISELNANRMKTAIKNELAAKGMNFNENSPIKIKISPEEYISETQNSQVGIGVGGGNRGFGTSVGIGIPINSEKLNQRYLVSIFNGENQLVWDGRLEIQMPIHAGPETIEANIQKGVAKLFKKYPPQK
jgi:hypothetical protein